MDLIVGDSQAATMGSSLVKVQRENEQLRFALHQRDLEIASLRTGRPFPMAPHENPSTAPRAAVDFGAESEQTSSGELRLNATGERKESDASEMGKEVQQPEEAPKAQEGPGATNGEKDLMDSGYDEGEPSADRQADSKKKD